ncbi:MAG: DUF6602 domain-containing protein [Candidatus Methanofastidiosia archaeon]
MNDTKPKTIELRKTFLSLQEQMIARLTTTRENVLHPEAKGSATELGWTKVLNGHLPKRYQAEKAFVLDANGNISDQIDIVVFDRQYSPLLFNQDEVLHVPAESVYAVIEVKQDLDKGTIEYAGQKAASVRKLRRTSVDIPHAGGTYRPKPHSEILAGILTLGCGWNTLHSNLESAITGLSVERKLHLGCSLQAGAFKVEYADNKKPIISICQREESLIFFFLHLLMSLQSLGTVPAVDFAEYAKSLKSE